MTFHEWMYLAFLSTAVPIWKILRRAGYSGWWTLVWFIPVVNCVGVVLFAYRSWPVEKYRPHVNHAVVDETPTTRVVT